MNFPSFPPLMHSPQVMSAHHLQPSPFSPDQFLSGTSPSIAPPPSQYHPHTNAESSDEELSSRAFIKKRPIEITEDLVEGRLETIARRRRRCRSHQTSRGRLEPPEFDFTLMMNVEPTTPPNRSRSPASFLSRDMTLSHAPEHLSYSPQSRRSPKNRRSTKVKRPCTTAASRKPLRESSPALVRSRSPLGRWTPPAVSAFQHFSVRQSDHPTTPPPCPTSSYSFDQQPHVWTNNFPWTIASPSASPYPSHSPRPHSPYQT